MSCSVYFRVPQSDRCDTVRPGVEVYTHEDLESAVVLLVDSCQLPCKSLSSKSRVQFPTSKILTKISKVYATTVRFC